MKINRKLPLVDATRFSMIPKGDVPRSTFQTQHTVKTTFDADYLVPMYVDEVLPGDVHRGDMTFFARLQTPIFPIMDNICVESFFFFVPCRLVWTNWRKFMGEQANPNDSIDFVVPQLESPDGGFAVGSLYDYFGLPTVGQIDPAQKVSINVLPIRAYNLIYNEWFRDENVGPAAFTSTSDGPDPAGSYGLQKRMKKHDYFTSCLPWPLKGGQEVNLPLGGTAPVVANTAVNNGGPMFKEFGFGLAQSIYTSSNAAYSPVTWGPTGGDAGIDQLVWDQSGLQADLSQAVGASLNATRLAIATQHLLEKDARGGTRYTELLRNHFGVVPEDSRLQRPEYIGGGKSYLKTQAIPQTSASAYGGTASTPLGSLGATILGSDGHPFRYMAKEHGYIIGLVNITGDVTYQQGLNKMWSRSTRYDFYWPAFANLGEQAVKVKEIYVDGTANDEAIFGYQERWAEYRHRPSRITGLFRSTANGSIDQWHLSEEFDSAPALNATFLVQDTPLERVLAAGDLAVGQQVLWDSVFNISSTRALPTHSVPGLVRF
ncbi:MAG: major capsid protein [Microviridae sp.]|nr:MAG: major capsid protein [Microviridae sp.]